MEILYIITPFKNTSEVELLKTIKSISFLRLNLKIVHLIIYDITSKEVIKKTKKYHTKNNISKNYLIKYLESPKQGIYYAINIGLDNIDSQGFYMVLGEGDIIKQKINTLNFKKRPLQIIDYKLNNHHKIINKFRNLYEGMPYCHNAIIFKNNELRYSLEYKISSDYDYFLKYIESNSLIIEDKKMRIEGLELIFESEQGISSKSIFRKNFENIKILVKSQKINGLIFYILSKLRKVFLLFIND